MSRLEILNSKLRLLVHASGLLIPFSTEATSRLATVAILVAVTILYIVAEFLRLGNNRLPLITDFTVKMSRDDERPHFIARPVYYAVGIVLSLVLFPENIGYASIVIVAVGDPVASLVGGRFGRTHFGQKTLEGFAAGLVVSFALASLWVSLDLALVGSITGMLLELLGVVDDNLTMPVGAGSAMLAASVLSAISPG